MNYFFISHVIEVGLLSWYWQDRELVCRSLEEAVKMATDMLASREGNK